MYKFVFRKFKKQNFKRKNEKRKKTKCILILFFTITIILHGLGLGSDNVILENRMPNK